MKKPIGLALTLAALCASAPSLASELTEREISVPGFADFLVVDGDTVWTTNDGRVEQWSTEGKRASVAVPKPCGTMAIAFGSLWVANCKDGDVYRIDPATARIMAKIPAGVGPSGELNVVAGAGSIWAPSETSGLIARIDPAMNAVVATIEVADGTSYQAFGYDALWVASGKSRSLQRVDPQVNAVTHTVGLGDMPGFLAAGEGAVWIQEQGDGTVARIDPASVAVTARIKVGDNLKWGDIDTGGGKIWLRTTDEQMFAVINPQTLTVVARYGKASGSGALRYTPSGIWTSAHDLQTLSWWTESPRGGN
jgi:virginiamycin B lyase